MPLDAPLQCRVRRRDAEAAALLLRAAGIAYADARGDLDETRMTRELEAAARLFVNAVDKGVVAGPPARLPGNGAANDD